MRNARSVWDIPTMGYKDAHFATFPPELVRRCILAGCPKDGVVLDPFAGSGTTGEVALKLGRRFAGIDLNSSYVDLICKRLKYVREDSVSAEAVVSVKVGQASVDNFMDAMAGGK